MLSTFRPHISSARCTSHVNMGRQLHRLVRGRVGLVGTGSRTRAHGCLPFGGSTAHAVEAVAARKRQCACALKWRRSPCVGPLARILHRRILSGNDVVGCDR